MPSSHNNPFLTQMGKQWRKQRIPVSGIFELTPRCTLDCKMCYVHLTEAQMGDRRELTTAQWLEIIDQCLENGLLYVLLTGGECMLHEGFDEIYLRLHNAGTVITVNTNGLLLTDQRIAFFKAHPPATIRITLYGDSEDSYEYCTGHRAYARITENIDKLIAAGFSPVIAVTVSKYCCDSFLGIMEFARQRNLRTTVDMSIIDGDPDTGRKAEDHAMTLEQWVEKQRELRIFKGGTFFDNEPILELPEILPDTQVALGLRCSGGRGTYAVRWYGLMEPCLSINEGAMVLEEGFPAAWEKVKACAARRRIPCECVKCRLTDICNPCALLREDPRNPGHCNPKMCRQTIARYNAGITTIVPKQETTPEKDETSFC